MLTSSFGSRVGWGACRLAVGVVVGVLLGVLLPATAVGQNDPPCPREDDTHGRFGVPEGESCDAAEGDFVSRCWLAELGNAKSGGGTVPNDVMADAPPAGYPLNIGLMDALSAPDFPPTTLDPVAGTGPLVPAEARHLWGPSPYATRPTERGLLDLITGVPLYQETDFELPFGGAVFRHIRTHGTRVAGQVAGAQDDYSFGYGIWYNPYDWYWDWNGLFWMMSESPLLLIDAS